MPGGQINGSPIESSSQKYSGSLLTQITSISFAIPARTEGRFAIVTNVGQGMRWTRVALLTRAPTCGRRSRVVLTPRRRRQASQKCLRGDGDKKARSPGRARRKPLKPLRAGMPGDPGATVVTNSCAFYFAHEAAGASGTRHSPRPPFQGRSFMHNSGASRREIAGVWRRIELAWHGVAMTAESLDRSPSLSSGAQSHDPLRWQWRFGFRRPCVDGTTSKLFKLMSGSGASRRP